MSHRDRFPQPDAEFNEYLERAVPHLLTNWERLVPTLPSSPGPSPGPSAAPADPRKAELEEKYNEWAGTVTEPGIYPKSQNPDTRTKTITGQKDVLRSEIESLMRNIFDDIPSSWLTPSDREILNIHMRDSEPSPHPQIIDPIIGLTPLTGGDLEVRVRNTTDETRPSKPLDHILVQVQYALVSLNDPAPPFAACILQHQSSKALFVMRLGVENIGKRFYGYFRWYDPIHPEDSGPWTQVHTMVLA